METLQHKKVKTRKIHSCYGCAREFPEGTLMYYHVQVDGGDLLSSYWCDICISVWERYMSPGDTIDEGELMQEYPEEYVVGTGAALP